METTVMKHSIVGDAWIQEVCRANPVQWVLNDVGERTGNFLSGPVRLVFCDALMEAKPGMRSQPESEKNPKKFGTGVLFTPYTDFTIFWEEYWRIAAQEFASLWNPQINEYIGMDNPLYDQKTKIKYDGYTPGLMALNTTSQFKPPVVDPRGNPITDASKVYPGVWAILSLNAYASGKQSPRKGPRFGIQAVVLIGDDKPLGGGAADPRSQFKGVQVKPPVAVSSAAFGGAAPPAGGPPRGGPPNTNAYYPAAPVGGMAGSVGRPPVPPPGSGDDDLSSLM